MLNPTFFQVDTQDGEMRLETARLDRVDPRILDDIGLTDAEWASATGSSSARVLLAAFLEKVRQVFVRRRLTERRLRFAALHDGDDERCRYVRGSDEHDHRPPRGLNASPSGVLTSAVNEPVRCSFRDGSLPRTSIR